MTTGLLRRTNVASISKRMRLRQSFAWDPSLVLYLPLYNDKMVSLDYNKHIVTNYGSVLIPDKGRSFDGVDDYGVISNNPTFAFTSAFTMELWVNVDTSVPAQHHFVLEVNDGGTKRLGLAARRNIGGNKIGVYDSIKEDWAMANSVATPGQFAHILVILNPGGNAEFYLDGNPDGTPALGATFPAYGSTTDVFIGTSAASGTEFLKGLLGEVRIYNRALTAGERVRNYQATKWRYQ